MAQHTRMNIKPIANNTANISKHDSHFIYQFNNIEGRSHSNRKGTSLLIYFFFFFLSVNYLNFKLQLNHSVNNTLTMTQFIYVLHISDECRILPVPSCLWKPKVWTSWEEHSPNTTETDRHTHTQKKKMFWMKYVWTWAPNQTGAMLQSLPSWHVTTSRGSRFGFSPHLVEESWQEEDSWLADHFTDSSPQQWLVKVSERQTKGADGDIG